MANKSKLRSEIQALRNQAKARGEVIPKETQQENTQQLNEKNTYVPNQVGTYAYVYHDLLRTLIFLLLIILFLFIVSIKLSNLPQFASIRTGLHITQFSF